MRVLVIKDNKPGHFNQSEGLVLALKEIYKNFEFEYIEVEIKSSFSREVLRKLLNVFSFFSLFFKKL